MGYPASEAPWSTWVLAVALVGFRLWGVVRGVNRECARMSGSEDSMAAGSAQGAQPVITWRWRHAVVAWIVAGFFWWTVADTFNVLGILGGVVFTAFGIIEATNRGITATRRRVPHVGELTENGWPPGAARRVSEFERWAFLVLYGGLLLFTSLLYLAVGPIESTLATWPLVLFGLAGSVIALAGLVGARRAYGCSSPRADVGGDVLVTARLVSASQSFVVGMFMVTELRLGGDNVTLLLFVLFFLTAVGEASGRGPVGTRPRHPEIDEDPGAEDHPGRVARAPLTYAGLLIGVLGIVLIVLQGLHLLTGDDRSWVAAGYFIAAGIAYTVYGFRLRRAARCHGS